MRKPAFLAFLAFTLIFVLTSCSSEAESSDKTDKTAAELMNTVLDSVEFPQTVEVNEESRLNDMGIETALTEDYAAVQQMLSVDVVEVIILKAKDGEINKLIEQLEDRKDALINEFAFYPEQVASANATVVGSARDVAYLICHVDAATAEKKLVEEINGKL